MLFLLFRKIASDYIEAKEPYIVKVKCKRLLGSVYGRQYNIPYQGYMVLEAEIELYLSQLSTLLRMIFQFMYIKEIKLSF
jgi:hypothetical protein